MPAKRIIACLDIKGGRVVKGVKFVGHEDMGDPQTLARRYCADGADEIVIYDIAASADRRVIDYRWLSGVAHQIDVPIAVAGGIRSLDQAIQCLESGADKVSINSPALERPEFITELARVAGSQCVVVGVDSRRDGDDWYAFKYAGDARKIANTGRRMLEWIDEAQARGAGEIVLNCMDSDGVRRGFDLEQLSAARRVLHVPLVASGGAGSPEDFAEAFARTDVSGALAAGVFHAGAVTVGEVKQAVARAGIEVRPC